jgi:hypothetical protein
MRRHVVTPLLGAAAVAGVAICGASSTEGAQSLFLCANPAGQARIVNDPAGCRGNETLVTFNVQGEQGPPGPPGPPGPANRVFGGSVNPDGTPQETGFTVEHTAGSGTYILKFPARTFTGSEGKFLLATVTPIGNRYVSFMSSVAPVQPDGSGFFEVSFAGGEVPFTFVIAVQIF